MTASCDILGMGCVAVDECFLLNYYPREDTKAPVLSRRRSLGGTTAAALAAASRYGARCSIAGRMDREQASFVMEEFQRYGVDTSLVQHAEDVQPIRSQVMVSQKTASRTILFDLGGAAGASEEWPPEDAIRAASLLLVDHFGMEGMLRAARIARDASIPIVADLETHQRPEFPELLSLVDHLIVSHELATELAGSREPGAACKALWSSQRRVVVVTCGREGCWSCSAEDAAPVHTPAFRVPTIDTTGCGDVFRGVYAAALLAGAPLAARLRQAAAGAALVASHTFEDADDRIPTRDRIEAFLTERAVH